MPVMLASYSSVTCSQAHAVYVANGGPKHASSFALCVSKALSASAVDAGALHDMLKSQWHMRLQAMKCHRCVYQTLDSEHVAACGCVACALASGHRAWKPNNLAAPMVNSEIERRKR